MYSMGHTHQVSIAKQGGWGAWAIGLELMGELSFVSFIFVPFTGPSLIEFRTYE